ncbi:helix-turn-helix domain-containing protein [Cystobacter fuscus]|uniref:GlxA family transcriptional regulator n=1 Tax=Cystobacter fuscus TaxID=43 RepID=UPI002B2816E1|nr:helix-turn-helix domain-containing protein [Cystobacter fuscus]
MSRRGPPPSPPPRPARRVLFALAPGVEVMDLAGPMQAFHEAAGFGHPYAVASVSPTPTVRTAQGLELAGLAPLPKDVGPGDRVIVPGYPVATTRVPPALLSWLRAAAGAGAQVCAVCTGAFALGEAGLLDGRRCTTHWRRTQELQVRFPRARVLGERLFVEDAGVITSAGISAGVDMALALLERDGGPLLASSVAREMVVYLRRDGAQSQDSVYLDFQTHLNPGVHRVQQYLVAHPEAKATLAELGRVASMSERNLTRAFRRATGISVHAYRERVRLERAKDLLRNPELTVEAVAEACGYADVRQLRRVWNAAHGAPPRRPAARGGKG